MNRFKLIAGAIAVSGLSLAFAPKPVATNSVGSNDKIELPDNIKAIVEAKCMGCHKPDARNEKAREKLQWVKVPEMNLEEQEDFVAEMFEVIEEGEMPPERTVERRPEMKLTAEENAAFIAWLEKEEKRLKGE
ncbi:heme-binding protein [Roseivirga pacifica]|uniref:Haem-binding domain-containing protein n=1 Tax=Roseivirga pacifica TaxID=1267423 RepID=A0A1I0R0H2_9BACT|nr:heme-binding domain-containing protein [Roseivirga pacifica]RKQ42283.1 heme-binding protein [Roseivirga pacifica]SEW33300.1 Haem-binding domain-containing protein [Roseivirga pacifica]